MNSLKQSPIVKVAAFTFTLFLLISIACGNNVTPQKVGEAKPEENTEAVATKVPAQPAEQPTEAPTEAPPPPQAETFKVGDIVNIGDSVLVVLGWEDVGANDFAKPDAGKKFIAVELLLVNKSQAAVSVSTMLQMSLKDNTGQKYQVDLMASTAAGGGVVDGELAPGERKLGKVSFQVPTEAQGLQFIFDAEVYGTGKAVVELGAAPSKVEPPAELAGETQQQTFKVGDVVEMGTLSLTVNGVTSPEGTDFAKPEQGKKFLIVDVTIENKSQEADAISTMMQMSLKDTSGQVYQVDLMAMAASGGTSPDGELAPGEKIRGQVGFQVPADANGLVFVFDADVFGAGKAFVALP